MPAQLLDGKKIAGELRASLKKQITAIRETGLRAPGLHVVRVGDDPASAVYVRMKEKAAAEVGIQGQIHHLPENTSREELLELIEKLNKDQTVDAVLVQLPLPSHLPEDEVMQTIRPEKDVDGFHVVNLGRLVRGEETVHACTPAGVMALIRQSGIRVEGANAIVVGRSNIVGKPVALMLLEANATVTVAHSRTSDLANILKDKDIVVVAVGRPQIVKGEWIKPGAVVIDVGINRLEDDSLVGDVGFDAALEHASWITPVPGGVGPMTIAYLLKNTLKLYQTNLESNRI